MLADCLISIEDRQAIIFGGFKYDGELYYKIDDFPADIQNVAFTTEDGFFTFDTKVTLVGKGAKINISNVKFYDNNKNEINVSKYDILYKLATSDKWRRVDNNEIEVKAMGEYYIKLGTKKASYNISIYKTSVDDTVESEYKIVNVTNKVYEIAGTELEETAFVEDINGDTAWLPGGYIIPQIEDEQEIKSGLVIKDSDENEWVWVPVSKSELTTNMITSASATLCDTATATNKYSKLWNFTSTGREIYSKVSGSYTYKVGTPGQSHDSATRYYREPDVVIGSDGSSHDASQDYYNTILSTNTKNLTVDINQEKSLNMLAQQFVNDYNNMIKSIEEYGGFYIGRYELSESDSTPKVVRYGASGNITWYNAYVACSQFTNEDAIGTMIWGTQWDATLEWLAQSNIKDNTTGKSYSEIASSEGWGNYSNSENFQYKETADGEVKTKSSSTLIPTGSTEYTKANNIYDLAGNFYEWTHEAFYTSYRVLRRWRLQP